MAEVVIAGALAKVGFGDAVTVDSAGLGDWHVGEGADERAVAALKEQGFDGSRHRARLFSPKELSSTSLLIGMDESHCDALLTMQGTHGGDATIRMMRSFDPQAEEPLGVADPYYGELKDFAAVLDQITHVSPFLVAHVAEALESRFSRSTSDQ